MQFKDIPGQETSKQKLLSLYNQSRLPHSLLLSGTDGSGSLALALAFCKYIMCSGVKTDDSCGECDNCSKISSFIHPDLHYSYPIINSDGAKTSDAFIEKWRQTLKENPFMNLSEWMDSIKDKDEVNKQGNITAEECRAIIRKLSLKAFEGGKKIMLVWLPEFMGNSSNILLKLVEEPPEDTHFILISEEINKILPTVISRSQIVNIPPFKTDEIFTYLKSSHNLNDNDATNISYISKGNLNLAISLIDETETEYTSKMRSWFQHCYSRSSKNIFDWVNTTSSMGREKIKILLENCNYVLNECLHCIYIDNYTPKVPNENQKFVADLSKLLNSEKINEIYNEINKTIYHIERNANSKISLTNLSFEVRNILHLKRND